MYGSMWKQERRVRAQRIRLSINVRTGAMNPSAAAECGVFVLGSASCTAASMNHAGDES